MSRSTVDVMEPADTRIQVRLDDQTAQWLAGRAERMHEGSVHQQARTELVLWHEMLAAERHRIRLTLPEINCLADVMNGTMLRALAVRPGIVYANCYDAFRLAREDDPAGISLYGSKHGIDEDKLLKYIGSLGPAADHALADAIARWWDREDLDSDVHGWAAVGLRIIV